MGKGKTTNRKKEPQRPPRPKYKRVADIYYSEKIAPLYREFNRAVASRNWDESDRLWNLIKERKQEFAILRDRNEKVQVN